MKKIEIVRHTLKNRPKNEILSYTRIYKNAATLQHFYILSHLQDSNGRVTALHPPAGTFTKAMRSNNR